MADDEANGERWWESIPPPEIVEPTGKTKTKNGKMVGRRPVYENAQQLYDAIVGYFEWNERNPLQKSHLVSYQGITEVEYQPKTRPLTIVGLRLHCGLDRQTWADWRNGRGQIGASFSAICRWAEDVIYRQKFDGAAADLFNHNIIARDLGLRDEQGHDHRSSDGSMSPKTLQDFYADLQATNGSDGDDAQ